MRYAQNTEVSSDRSRSEIERTLTRYGATEFAYATRSGMAMIGFAFKQWQLRFLLPLPKKEEFMHTEKGRLRKENQVNAEWERAGRQRWRAQALVIKAKLEAVECGITTFEEEFMAHIVIPGSGGKTVGDRLLPDLRSAKGKLPPLLEMPKGKETA